MLRGSYKIAISLICFTHLKEIYPQLYSGPVSGQGYVQSWGLVQTKMARGQRTMLLEYKFIVH